MTEANNAVIQGTNDIKMHEWVNKLRHIEGSLLLFKDCSVFDVNTKKLFKSKAFAGISKAYLLYLKSFEKMDEAIQFHDNLVKLWMFRETHNI
jgi:hypothetical protein